MPPSRTTKLLPAKLVDIITLQQWNDFPQHWSKVPVSDKRRVNLLQWLMELNAPKETLELVLKEGYCEMEKVDLDVYNSTPLVYAAHVDNAEYVKLLLKHGANPKAKSSKGGSALHFAAESGNKDIIFQLVEHGCDANMIGEERRSALMTAIMAPTKPTTLDVVRYLVKERANLDHVDSLGETALFYAIRQTNVEVVDLLLDSGAAPNVTTPKDKMTPLLFLAKMANEKNQPSMLHMARSLLEHGADVNAADEESYTPLVRCSDKSANAPLVELLLLSGACVYIDKRSLITAMKGATMAETSTVLKLLLQAGGDPNESFGMSHDYCLLCHSTQENCMLLIKAGADLACGAKDAQFSILFEAIERRDEALVQFIVQYGVDKSTGFNAECAYEYVQRCGWTELLHLVAFEGCGIPVRKPKRLSDEDFKLNMEFAFCANCRKPSGALRACAACEMVAYCDTKCQHEHWDKHKKICKNKQRADERARTTPNCV